MILGGIKVDSFARICLVLEATFSDYPLPLQLQTQ